MNTLLSHATRLSYKYLAKPVLFRLKPDFVHNHMLTTSKIIQKNKLARRLLSYAWAHEDTEHLQQTIHGVRFTNPVGLSAGFDKNAELPPIMQSLGFGFTESGSITHQPYTGNPRPWFHRLPRSKSLVVHAGLPNQGAAAISGRLAGYELEFPVVASIAKTNTLRNVSDASAINDYTSSLETLRGNTAINIFEINISCPNTYGGEPFTSPGRLDSLLRHIDDLSLQQPVFIKMPVDLAWSDFNDLLNVIVTHNVRGVTISNLRKERDKSDLQDPLPDAVRGGLSGKPVEEKSNELIRRTYLEHGKRLTIIGVGGIFSAEDAYTKITLGASLVELITGMIFEGPQLIGQINKGLVALLQADGFTHISQAIGSAIE